MIAMSLPDHTPVATSWQDVLDALVAIVDTGEAFLDRLDAPSTEARATRLRRAGSRRSR